MIDKATELFGEFTSSFGKTWATSGGALIPHGASLAANAAAGAAVGMAHNAYMAGDWHNAFTADGLEAAAVGVALHVGGHSLWSNRKALKQSLFTASSATDKKAQSLYSGYKNKTGAIRSSFS